ncbi:MAG: hypothetical protein QM500_08655, partial [Methylococcales bacterium]
RKNKFKGGFVMATQEQLDHWFMQCIDGATDEDISLENRIKLSNRACELADLRSKKSIREKEIKLFGRVMGR